MLILHGATSRAAYPAYGFDHASRIGARADATDSGRVEGRASAVDERSSQDKNGRVSSNDGADKTTGVRLTPDEERQVRQLAQTDRAVRQHEQAHMAAGGGLVRGGATYSYQTGPDNRRYATGGEVSIDASAGRTPQETISKAQRIRAAALAPADPSPQDRSVAAKASQMEAQAHVDLARAQRETASTTRETEKTPARENDASAKNAANLRFYSASVRFSAIGRQFDAYA